MRVAAELFGTAAEGWLDLCSLMRLRWLRVRRFGCGPSLLGGGAACAGRGSGVGQPRASGGDRGQGSPDRLFGAADHGVGVAAGLRFVDLELAVVVGFAVSQAGAAFVAEFLGASAG